MSASGTHVDVNDAYATRLLPRGRFECGRVESNHHSHGRRGYSALSSPVLGVRKGIEAVAAAQSRRLQGLPRRRRDPAGRVPLPRNPPSRKNRAAGRARTDTAGITTPDACRYITAAKRNGRRDRLPATGGRDVTVRWPRSQLLYLSAVLPARCRAATSSPVGPGGLSAQLHVRARALPSPCSVTSSTRPSTGRSSNSYGAGGIRTHGLELMRLARTAAPLPRVAL